MTYIKKLLLVLVCFSVAILTALNFTYPLIIRLTLALVLFLINLFSFSYTWRHWHDLWTGKYSPYQELGLLILGEGILLLFMMNANTHLTGLWYWLWVLAFGLCQFGCLLLLGILFNWFVHKKR